MINTYHVIDIQTSVEYDISVDRNTLALLLERHIVALTHKEDKEQWLKEEDQQQD